MGFGGGQSQELVGGQGDETMDSVGGDMPLLVGVGDQYYYHHHHHHLQQQQQQQQQQQHQLQNPFSPITNPFYNLPFSFNSQQQQQQQHHEGQDQFPLHPQAFTNTNTNFTTLALNLSHLLNSTLYGRQQEPGSNLSILAYNLSHLLNLTQGIDLNLIHRFERNRRVSDAAFVSLLVAYSLLIVLGATGNSLVVLAVVRKPAMRTARNVFIINLAISDLLLCLVTMPLTLMELLTQYWPLGDTPLACSLVGTLQATSIFVSTISITAIALDRYH
ncbi:hypothetical protein Pmani_032748, partial [Petrolisthes manimaculis]